MKIIVAGSRTFADYPFLKRKLDHLTKKLDKKKLIIVSGGASGADKMGERWAFERYVTVMKFHAEWKKYKKAAGPIRNEQMAEFADALVAFWDGQTPGTESMIELAREYKLKICVISV